MDITTLLGLVLGIGGILIGNLMEGGHMSALLQMAAFFIVFGGTIGATLVASPLRDFLKGIQLLKVGFGKEDEKQMIQISAHVVEAAKQARKDSILSLEKNLGAFPHEFMQKTFRLVIDGVEHDVIREVFEKEIEETEENDLAGANIWSEAGGYAPTIGIIGAVLGLIHVMSNLTNTSELGKGIAVAFVATIYGVGSANLIFLPLSSKIKRKIQMQTQIKRMILEGALAIAKGYSPYVIEEKMKAFTSHLEDEKTS